MKILDLGCGENKVKGAIGLDNVALNSVDIVHDLLDFPYPFENETFDFIYLRHVIEHFDINDINKILNECHRILINGCKIEIRVPHTFSVAAFTDPTHKTFFTFYSGYFWDKNHTKQYYKEINSSWELDKIESKICWYDWKRFQFRKVDTILSKMLSLRINYALKNINNPSLADRLVKKYNLQFCEITWTFRKTYDV